jgi:polyisoprenyl-phosphate glycosyltransferase
VCSDSGKEPPDEQENNVAAWKKHLLDGAAAVSLAGATMWSWVSGRPLVTAQATALTGSYLTEYGVDKARHGRLSVVVPCYNEAEGLTELHRRLTAACRACQGENYEIVLVNDGSRDQTLSVLVLLAENDPHVVVVNLARNYGHQIALSAGLQNCDGDRILVIDADLQDPPELLPQMMFLMDEGADVVYGQRRRRRGEPWFRKIAMRLYYRILRRLVDIDIPLDTGDFRLITRRVLNVLNAMPEQHRFIRGMVSWIGLKQVPLVYDRDGRFAGESSFPFRKLVRLAVDGVTGFSVVPLRVASYFGVMTGVIGIIMLIYSVGGWLFTSAPIGWASQTSIILVLGSGQLIVLGIVGEYLGRLYMESKRRPIYLVESIIKRSDRLNREVGRSVTPKDVGAVCPARNTGEPRC